MQTSYRTTLNNLINKTPPKKKSFSHYSNPQSNHKNALNYKNQIALSISQLESLKLKQNKQKLIQTLEVFYLIQENKIPQRCIAHNTDLSLYCINEHKLICVNCVYNNKIHDKHKVTPSNVAVNDIKKDNTASSYKIALNLNQIEDDQREIQDYLIKGELVRNTVMNNLQKQYEEIRKYLQTKYLALKIQLVQKFEEFKQHSEILIKQFKQLKQVVNQKMFELDFKQDKIEIEIFKHLVLSNLAEFTNLKQKFNKPKLNLEIMPQYLMEDFKKFKQHIFKYKWTRI